MIDTSTAILLFVGIIALLEVAFRVMGGRFF